MRQPAVLLLYGVGRGCRNLLLTDDMGSLSLQEVAQISQRCLLARFKVQLNPDLDVTVIWHGNDEASGLYSYSRSTEA